MTDEQPDFSADTRVIEPEHETYNARLVKRVEQTDELATFWVRFDGEPIHFEPGQYMTIGVYADGKLVQRPYSVASPPEVAGDEGYEFYVRRVPIMRFTTLLWRLPVGHGMRMIGPKGRFLLEPDDERTHLFVSTGTGIAPFIAMMRQQLMQGRPRRTVMLNGSSYVDELGYREQLEDWEASGTFPLSYVPTISRSNDPRNADWTGPDGPRRVSRSGRLSRSGARARADRRLHLRQPGDDHQRRGAAAGRRLPGVPRQEGALLAEGQNRPCGGNARRRLTHADRPCRA